MYKHFVFLRHQHVINSFWNAHLLSSSRKNSCNTSAFTHTVRRNKGIYNSISELYSTQYFRYLLVSVNYLNVQSVATSSMMWIHAYQHG
jgi:hypothetical protein